MKTAISYKNVKKFYGDLKAVNGITLNIKEGEFFGLLGPNGAGKSTLINMLAGLAKPSTGKISVMGYDVQNNYQEARHSVGIVPQELVFDPFFNVREMLRFQAGYFGKGKENDVWVDEVIERLDLTDKASTNMRKLSGGMKRRALIAQALVHKPPVIVLDEPTAGVDVELRQKLWEFIKDLNNDGHTIVLTTHYLEEAQELCNSVAMLRAGKVVAMDTTKNLLRKFATKNLKLKLNFKGEEKLPQKIDHIPHQIVEDAFIFQLKRITDITEITEALKESRVEIADIQTVDSDLEDVFLKLTNSNK
ncbi:MAG: ABC transporter ATP-binding protein [Methylophilaceae bacterium]|jgi:ABC-2 type transport system ATP-binding protein